MKSEMTQTRGVVPIAVLLPHAPILVPAVAGEREPECHASIEAMAAAAARLVRTRPQAVVLLSPHAARAKEAFGVSRGALSGDLGRFGARASAVALPGDPALAEAFGEVARAHGLRTEELPGRGLDHGSVVPLWFLAQAGWLGPTVVVALSATDNSRVAELGECVALAAERLGRRVAVVASGDMSHRLKPGAPCGYDPAAADFDREFIAQLRRRATHDLAGAVAALQDCAAEDVVEPTLFALGAVGWGSDGREVLGYEGPFGVGYGVAVLYAEETDSAGEDPRAMLPAVARSSLAELLQLPAELAEPKFGTCPGDNGVFVTLHCADGRLRGCIGTLASHSGDLAVETWRMAREAAWHDPRFSRVRADELASLKIEVTVLEPMEEIGSEAELDPRRWGVVVRSADGRRRGLLLPDIPEVTSVAQQVSIARAKGGIGADEPVRLQRFAARRFVEEPRP